MIKTTLSIALVISAFFAANARAQSEYYRVHPLTGTPAIGRLGEMTKDKVRLELSSGNKEFAVNDIKFVQLPSEPRELTEARNFALDGKYDQALATLDKIPPPLLANEAIRQDADYYRTLANARLAINHAGDAKPAGMALVAYINANKNSYHFYEANETAGDLLVTIGRYEQAIPYFRELSNAAWPDYKMRGLVDIGRALQMQGKFADAIGQFDAALAIEAKGKAAEAQLLAAKVGKGRSLTELGRAKEGLQILRESIDQAAPDQFQALAQAYNALGATYVKLMQPKDALDAYLHVTLLYNQFPDQHAEALFHLKELWKQLNKPDSAKQAAELLKTRYVSSPWNK
jgi:hypothetical protein